MTELRLALRRLRRSPLFTTFAVVTLAVAIGITTAVYSILRAGLQPETGIGDGESFIMLADARVRASSGATRISWLDYSDVLAQASSVRDLAAWTPFSTSLFARASSDLVRGEAVSGSFFGAVGIQPIRGRFLNRDDDRPDAAPVAIVSAAVWRSRFGNDPGAIGEAVKVGGRIFQIVGVAPPTFRGASRQPGFAGTEVWIPLSLSRGISTPFWDRMVGNRDNTWISVGGRLKEGQTKDDAAAELSLIARRIDAVAPLAARNSGAYKPTRDWTAVTAAERFDFTEVRDVARAMLLIPTLVLLVACTNVANFALSRGIARQHEFSVRKAIGASRWQLMRGQLIEYAVITVAAASGGVAIAAALLRWVGVTMAQLSGNVPEFRLDVRIDGPILAAVGAAAVVSFLVAALLPTIKLTGKSLRQSISGDQGAVSPARWRGRSNLIALQISVSVALLLVTALCIRQLPKIGPGTASGMATDRIALVQIPFSGQSISPERARRTIDRLIEDLRTIPGVAAAAVSSGRRQGEGVELALEGRAFPERRGSGPTAKFQSVSPDYFQSVGLPLVAGRPIDARDTAGGAPVAVLNETQARTLFGTTDVVDRRLQTRSTWFADRPTRILTIVGVVGDVRSRRGDVEHTFYVPMAQRLEEFVPVDLLALAAPGTDPARMAAVMRQTLRAIDPEIAVTQVGRADTFEFGPEIVLQYFSLIFGGLAVVALVFAASGLYGVLSHVVAGRTRELGVRAALGADRRHLLQLVMKDGFRPVLEGVVIGFGLAAGARVGIQPWFEEPVTAVDPIALLIALIPLLAASLLACYLPARRAAAADPNVALRHL